MSALRFRVLPRSSPQVEADKQHRQLSTGLLIALFTLPGLVLFTLFVLIPIAQSAVYSLYDWDGLGPLTEYVGVGNYERLLDHSVFQVSLGHTVSLMLLSLGIQLPLALGLALLVGRGRLRARKLLRTILFIPFVFSEIITAIIWRYVLHPDEGLLNTTLGTLIPGYEPIGWLGDRSLVLFGIFAVLTWKYFGFHDDSVHGRAAIHSD